MKKQILSLLALLFSMTASAASTLITDSVAINGNRLAQLAQQVEVSLRNNSATDYEGRLYLMAYSQSDGSLTPCLDTLVTVKAYGIRQLWLYPTLPEGELQLRLSTNAGCQEWIGSCDVIIQPLRKLDMKAMFSLDMLADADGEQILYGSRIKGWASVKNYDLPYFGAHDGKSDDDGIVLWIEDRDSGERLFTKHIANGLNYWGEAETTFTYDATFRDGARYVLKAGYGMPYGLDTIDSLCFTTRAGTNTYWTAKGKVLPLPVDKNGRKQVPVEAVAVDLRGLNSSAEGGSPSQTAIDASQANPNCLYYLDPSDNIPQGLDESRNLVRGLEATNIKLTEGHDYYCPLAFRARFISYLMTPSYDNADDEARGRGYSETIVLPFRPSHINLYDINGETEALHADMLKVLRYYGYEADTLNVAEISSLSQMQAYEPYILGVYIGSSLLFVGEDTQVPMTGEAIVRGGSLDFVGTTVGLRLKKTAYAYSPADNSFHLSVDGETVAPFHAYLNALGDVTRQQIDISNYAWGQKGNPNEATAINGLRQDEPQTDAPVISDLEGRKVAYPSTPSLRLKKGIYIVDGHKVVVN